MRPFERRQANAYPYYTLAVWDDRAVCWRAGKRTFATADEARESGPAGALCRVSVVTERGHTELEPFVR